MDENRINLRTAVPEDAEAVYRVHVTMGGSIPWSAPAARGLVATGAEEIGAEKVLHRPMW